MTKPSPSRTPRSTPERRLTAVRHPDVPSVCLMCSRFPGRPAVRGRAGSAVLPSADARGRCACGPGDFELKDARRQVHRVRRSLASHAFGDFVGNVEDDRQLSTELNTPLGRVRHGADRVRQPIRHRSRATPGRRRVGRAAYPRQDLRVDEPSATSLRTCASRVDAAHWQPELNSPPTKAARSFGGEPGGEHEDQSQ
jgi:hypothetical protein